MTDPQAIRSVLHRDLLRRQLDALVPDHAESCRARSARLAEGFVTGLATVRRLIAEAGVGDDLLVACRRLATEDPRFGYLHRLPGAAAFGGAAAAAVGRAFRLAVDQDAVDLTTLMNVSITLVDGLLDDAPDLFRDGERQIRTILADHLDSRRGRTGGGLRADTSRGARQTAGSDHPVVTLTLAVVQEWSSRARRARGIEGDPSFHRAFCEAAYRALDAEIAATRLQPLRTEVDPDACAKAVAAKSANALWLTAVAALSGVGWPAGVEPHALRDAMERLGRYFGWIDDLVDLLEDLDAARWNQAHLSILEGRAGWSRMDIPTLTLWVAGYLADDQVTGRIINSTVGERDRALLALSALAPLPEAMEQLIADATYSWLTGRG